MPAVQQLLQIVLRYQKLKAEGRDSTILRQMALEVEPKIESLWRQLAALAALKSSDWSSDDEHPGYVQIPLSTADGSGICIPFHLVPARPELPVLQEIVTIASRVALGAVEGRRATICLSGSTLILKDVLNVGDIDFCEYIPNDVPAAAMAEAIKTQILQNDLRQCTVSIRMRQPGGGGDELRFVSITPQSTFTPEQLDKVREALERAKNGQTFHLLHTNFGGITEATNWLIIFQPPLEGDAVSGLSFAHQEASLGIFGRRRLHTVESIAAYMGFLGAEIKMYSQTNPAKAFKRSISWLRMFGNKELLRELKEAAVHFQVPQAASILSKVGIWEKYARMSGLNPNLQALVDGLKAEIDSSSEQLVGQQANPEDVFRETIMTFGVVCATSQNPGVEALWDRILNLAVR